MRRTDAILRPWFVVLLACALTFTAAACGSDDDTDPVDGDQIVADGDDADDIEDTDDVDVVETVDGDEDVVTEQEDPTSENGTTALRDYFCTSDGDCRSEETCLPMPGAEERICQPKNFVRFIDATTFIIDTTEIDYEIVEDDEGKHSINVKGFSSLSSPGDPDLPSISLAVLLPPNADPTSVTVQVIDQENETLEGEYDIKPAGPANYRAETADGQTYEDYITAQENIVDGRNIQVYDTDALWTDTPARVHPYQQMRKWRFVQVEFFPFRTNPVQKSLEYTRFMKIHIATSNAKFGAVAPVSRVEMMDSVLDDQAPEWFVNYQQAKKMYAAPRVTTRDDLPKSDYVIITTADVRQRSSKLDDFVDHKKSIGYKVLVVDETMWGQSEGADGPEKVRNWLKANYAARGIQYVLLFADPMDTDGPAMRECWPRNVKNGKDNYERTATDAYYADLTGNWDKDGDGIWCEYGRSNGDTGSGGVDLTPELYVGRIPVYGTSVSDPDSILERTIAYEVERDIAWRYKTMLPNPMSDYSHEEDHGDNGNEVKDRGYSVDGAKYAERMKRDFLNSRYNISTTTLYEKRGPEPSRYDSDIDFGTDNVLDEWKKGYGLVAWWAHGNTTSAAGKVWPEDTNEDGIAQISEKDWEDFAYSSHSSSRYNPEKPAFTSQVSCLNSRPDRSSNLGYTLLKKGGAITTLGATSVTLYSPVWSSPNYQRMDNVSFGYYYTKNLVKNYSAGKALAKVRSMSTSFSWGDGTLMNELSFNLFGDPSLSMFTTYAPAEEPADPKLTDNGHSFDATAMVDTTEVLEWKLRYSLEADPGTMGIAIEVLDENGAALQNAGTPIVVSNTISVGDDALSFDGDNPDVHVLAKDALAFLGYGVFDLQYRIRYTYTPEGGDAQDLLITSAKNFAVTFEEPVANTGELQPGTPVTGSVDEAKGKVFFTLHLDADGVLALDLEGPGDADFDLYIKKGADVETNLYDGRGYTATSREHIDIAEATAGDYAVMVHSYSGTGDFTLTATFTGGAVQYDSLAIDDLVEGNLPAPRTDVTYEVTIDSAGVLDILAEGPEGSVLDLYLSRDIAPSTAVYDVRSSGGSKDPELQADVTPGTYYLMIRSRSGSGDFSIYASLTAN